MIFKLTLCVVVFMCCSITGFVMASSLDKRYKALKELQSAVNVLKARLIYYIEPVKLAIERAAGDIGGEAGEVFQSMAELIDENGCADAFVVAVKQRRTFSSLSYEDICIFYDLFSRLGQSSEEQNAALQLAEARMEAAIKEAYEIKHQKGRLYATSGILTGALLCIILI